jgi:hypothetical protein
MRASSLFYFGIQNIDSERFKAFYLNQWFNEKRTSAATGSKCWRI